MALRFGVQVETWPKITADEIKAWKEQRVIKDFFWQQLLFDYRSQNSECRTGFWQKRNRQILLTGIPVWWHHSMSYEQRVTFKALFHVSFHASEAVPVSLSLHFMTLIQQETSGGRFGHVTLDILSSLDHLTPVWLREKKNNCYSIISNTPSDVNSKPHQTSGFNQYLLSASHSLLGQVLHHLTHTKSYECHHDR